MCKDENREFELKVDEQKQALCVTMLTSRLRTHEVETSLCTICEQKTPESVRPIYGRYETEHFTFLVTQIDCRIDHNFHSVL